MSDIKAVKDILIKEKETLEILLKLLQEQYDKIIQKDVFALESIVDKLQEASRNVAIVEKERRKITGNDSMKKIIEELKRKDKDVEKYYDECVMALEMTRVQKESNDILLKQNLVFVNSMLSMMKPKDNRATNVYNSYGSLGR